MSRGRWCVAGCGGGEERWKQETTVIEMTGVERTQKNWVGESKEGQWEIE